MRNNKVIMSSLLLNVLLVVLLLTVVQATVGLSNAFSKVTTVFASEKKNTFDERYLTNVAIFEEKAIKNGSVIFLGDSITESNEWSESFEVDNVYNRGIYGDTTNGILNRLSYINQAKPSKVFLMIGVNDLSKGTSKEEVFNQQLRIVNEINQGSPGTDIYIQSILPIDSSRYKVKNEDIIWINKQLSKSSDSEGYTFIDLYSIFVNEKEILGKEWTVDGLHLNGKAYTEWEKVIAKYVTS